MCQRLNLGVTTESRISMNIISRVRDGSVMGMTQWNCNKMNSALEQKILNENVRLSLCDFNLKCTCFMLEGNNATDTSKSITEWLKRHYIYLSIVTLNQFQVWWCDHKQVFCTWKPSKTELKQCTFIPLQWCKCIIPSIFCYHWWCKQLSGLDFHCFHTGSDSLRN